MRNFLYGFNVELKDNWMTKLFFAKSLLCEKDKKVRLKVKS